MRVGVGGWERLVRLGCQGSAGCAGTDRGAGSPIRQAQDGVFGYAGMTGMGAERSRGWRVPAVMAMPAMQSVQALMAVQARRAGISSSGAKPPGLDTLARATNMGTENYAGRMGGPWRCMLLVAKLCVCRRGAQECLRLGAQNLQRLTV